MDGKGGLSPPGPILARAGLAAWFGAAPGWLAEPNPRPEGFGREIKYFDIKGKQTGLVSRALTSPDGKIRIPINESTDDHSQIEEYLREYKGEGIQHIAIASEDIYAGTDRIAAAGMAFMPGPPDTYYEMSHRRVKGHQEPIERMKKHGILIDGEGVVGGGTTRVLLQIFSKTVIGPIFFEFIQRKGDDGFGEGNFRALFESIEETAGSGLPDRWRPFRRNDRRYRA